ncbi:hypothetical protein BDA96_03G195000 [Sorghum bicolor]|uniref:Uncharacterized protein n=2 Tax=Sorghum bicolor TaxID=4558 RepID=A0A921UNX8_SORBI|nr:hypothetical protein BDA96_03G195000 [Sorghum bicolor]
MRQPPDLALIQAVKVRPRKRDEKNTALPSSRPMTRLLAPTSRPIVKKLQKRGYKSYLAMKFPKSCIHIGHSLDIYSFYFVLILIHMDSELARKSYCRTTYRASLGQTLDSKNTLFAGKFQQRGQVRVYHISQAAIQQARTWK